MLGYDAKRAFANNSGLGNYSRFVIDGISSLYPDEQIRLFSPARKVHPALAPVLARENVRQVFPSGLSRLSPSLWRIRGITADIAGQGVSLFHGLSNELPFGLRKKGIASVVTVHDVVFVRYPEFYNAPDRAVYTLKTRHACREADLVIAVSECTKRDLVTFFSVPPEKIHVVYQGCAPAFAEECSQEGKEAVARKYRLPEKFVLSVGTVEQRKNLLLAVKALPLLPGDLHLVAVGRETGYAREVRERAEENGVTDRVHIMSGVAFQDLPAIYRCARAFVYPSFFEGFGIPILEAVTSGIPVVAATGSSLEEAGGQGSLFIDPHDHEALAEALRGILANDDLRDRMIREGLAHAARFTCGVLARELMDCYRSARATAASRI